MKHLKLAIVACLACLPGLSPGGASAAEPDQFLFNTIWARTDLPVASEMVARTWMWGPAANTLAMVEPYQESPGGQRTVQYFDKSRMEVTHPDDDPGALWYVTNGLLVVELITGEMQVGDEAFESREPAAINVAGDSSDESGPTYATLQAVLDADPLPLEDSDGLPVVIVQEIDREGNVSEDSAWAAYAVTTAYTDEVTNHTIAEPFWEFMNSSGIVYTNNEFTEAPLFENPFFATGRPVTEAYWTNVLVAGVPTDVLVQCFERRCLTYTPDNPEGWQVEAGNVGRHYFHWRYGEEPAAVDPPASIYLVNPGDLGASGILFGCQDSLVEVNVSVNGSVEEQITQALQILFSIDQSPDPETGLTSALAQSDLTIDSVAVAGGRAEVALSGQLSIGGVCDNPRVEKQIEQTVLQFPGVDYADITLNGTPLDDLLSLEPLG